MTSAAHDLKTLVLSFHPLLSVETVEEERLFSVLASTASALRVPLFEWTIVSGLVRIPDNAPFHGTRDPLGLLKYIRTLSVDGLFLLKDFAPFLENQEVRRQFRELAERFSHTRSTLVLCGITITLPPEIAHWAVPFRLRFPEKDELKRALEEIILAVRQRMPVSIELRTEELNELLQALSGMTLKQARQTIAYCIQQDGRLDSKDLREVIARKAESIRQSGLLEFYPWESNSYELGGFENLKRWLERARIGFSPEAQRLNLSPPRGILLVGVQGCGKSLAAKCIAREWKLPLLKLDAARLFDKYIGESEKNLRRAVDLAESMAPVVLWIDEIEKGLTPGQTATVDGGVSLHLLGFFLTWMQEKRQEVFIVATANDLTVLPPEFLRKGRFDELFFVDLPDREERRKILEIHLRLHRQNPALFDFDALVGATDGFSGAEIEQAVISSLYRALHTRSPLDTATILAEVRQTIPLSVTRKEEVARLRDFCKGRFVPAR